jgi:hypothetical protein
MWGHATKAREHTAFGHRAVGQVLGIARQKGVPMVGIEQLPEPMRPQ